MVKFLQEKERPYPRMRGTQPLYVRRVPRTVFPVRARPYRRGGNGVWITASLAILMLALNFFVYYLVLFLGRIVGKCILAFIHRQCRKSLLHRYLSGAITDKMMGSVFNTPVFGSLGILLVVGRMVPPPAGESSVRLPLRGAVRLRKPQAVLRPHGHSASRLPDRCPAQYAELAVDRPQRAQAREPDHAVVLYGQLRTLLQLRPETQPEGDSVARRTDRDRKQGPLRTGHRRVRKKGEFLTVRIRQADQSAARKRRCGRH